MSELPFCQCGCGERVSKVGNRFINNHHRRGVKFSPEHIKKRTKSRKENRLNPKPKPIALPCECGCGELAKPGDRFINGHNSRGENNSFFGKTHTPNTIKKLIESAKGKHDGDKNGMYGIRGGQDIVNHHYIYDHDELSLNTVQMTRSDHMRLHNLLKKLGYIVPHINVKEDN